MNVKVIDGLFWENKVFPIALSLCFGFMATYFILGHFGVIPSLEPGAVIGEAWRWCERISSSIFREPVNALCNLGFMIVGLTMYWVLSREERDPKNQFTGLTPISMLYAGAVIYLGPGSSPADTLDEIMRKFHKRLNHWSASY